jgi:ubiquinone/menaquinone biosynthesis C-methylase UbiE
MSISFDRVANIYDDTRRMPDEVMAQIVDAIACKVNPSSGLMLEVGIGTGRMALPLAERGFSIAGVDISEKMLSQLQAKSSVLPRPLHIVYGDATRMPFRQKAFHAVLAVHVLHLVDSLDACLVEARRVLQPGGVLLFGGSRRLMRYIQQVLRTEYDYGLEDDFVNMLGSFGVKLADQDEVEKRVMENLCSVGARVEELAPVEWDHEITCGEIVRRIEGRVSSYLWNVPDDVLKKLVEKLKSRLASSVGPPETVVRFRRSFCMTCARFPGRLIS